MPRVARIVVPRMAHHVTQRGNNRQDVFFVDDDRVAYLNFLAMQCERYRVALLGYCLMTNHTHLLLVPTTVETQLGTGTYFFFRACATFGNQ